MLTSESNTPYRTSMSLSLNWTLSHWLQAQLSQYLWIPELKSWQDFAPRTCKSHDTPRWCVTPREKLSSIWMIYWWWQEIIRKNTRKWSIAFWIDWPSWIYIWSQESVNLKSEELNSWELYWKTAQLPWTQSKLPEWRTGRLPET